MTRERKELIQAFKKWFATNPNPNIIAAQCANIAEDYADSKIKKIITPDVINQVCHEPTLHCQSFLNHGFSVCEKCDNFY